MTKYLPFIFGLTYLFAFAILFILQGKAEFIYYLIVVLILGALLLTSYVKGVPYSQLTIWLLTIWGLLHLLGGQNFTEDKVIYEYIILDLVGEPYSILKYDQVVHIYGFFTAAFFAFDLLKDKLRNSKIALIFSIVLISMGLGVVNEIIEFTATVVLPDTNVGGYINNSLDLVFNTVGALLAAIFIYFKLR